MDVWKLFGLMWWRSAYEAELLGLERDCECVEEKNDTGVRRCSYTKEF